MLFAGSLKGDLFNKAFLCSRFQDWFAQQVAAQKKVEKPVEPVDLRLSMMKPLWGTVDGGII